MDCQATTELILVRHAPANSDGKLCGRTDVTADCADGAAIAALRTRIGMPQRIIVSPARRCLQTASAIWPDGGEFAIDAALWEQDFGEWEGCRYSDLPDLGAIPLEALVEHCPPGGESFADLCARVHPALVRAASQAGPVAMVCHAGTVRAALSLALGSVPKALIFDVSPLSLTRLRAVPGGDWAILSVNERVV